MDTKSAQLRESTGKSANSWYRKNNIDIIYYYLYDLCLIAAFYYCYRFPALTKAIIALFFDSQTLNLFAIGFIIRGFVSHKLIAQLVRVLRLIYKRKAVVQIYLSLP